MNSPSWLPVLFRASPASPLGRVTRSLWLVALLSVAVALGAATTANALVQFGLATSAVVLLAVGCFFAPRHVVVGLILWLAGIGTVRRLLLGSGAAGDQDPLLLVAPATVGLLVVVAAGNGAFRHRTPLANGVMALSGIVLLSPFNPLHGGLAVGLAGLLFVLVPLLWFWVGRALVNERLLCRLLTVLSALAVAAAVYGLFQAYRGFPPWDNTWIDAKGYAALRVAGSLRQFASFASTAEYVGVLAIGIVLSFLRIKRGSAAVVAPAILALLGWATVVASVRGVLVVLPVTLGVLVATRRGAGTTKIAAAGLTGLVVLGLVVASLDSGSVGGARTSALLARQVEGLADPLNPAVSTLPVHVELLLGGLGEAVRNPIGQGLGVVTRAGAVFGSGTENTEVDPSNVAVALGLPGILVYCFVVVLGLRLAFRTARSRRDYLSLAALGILLVTFFQWLNGGAYLVAPLPWLVLGWLDRRSVLSECDGEDAAGWEGPISASNPSATRPRLMVPS